MSAADDLRAHLARTAAKPSTKSSAGHAAADARHARLTAKLTVRLPIGLNHEVKQLLLDLAAQHDLPRVSAQQLTEALYEELLASTDLQHAAMRRLT